MALSCYSNWSFPQAEPDLQMELFDFQNSFFLDQNPSIDPIFDTDFNNPHTKRIKTHDDNTNCYNNYIDTELLDTELLNTELPILFDDESILYPTLMPEFLPPFNYRQNFDCSYPVLSTGVKESTNTKAVVSTQSIAARQRRRRITDKTQELGKLIPGAHKMNTAEMFGAAYKYVQFLQAQVGVLQFMNTVQDNEDKWQTRQLQKLVSSTHVQQKLYSSEKCLVPKQLLLTIQGIDQPMINSNSALSKELQNLISNSG